MGEADGCFANKAITNTSNGVGYAKELAWNTGNDGISFSATRSSAIYKETSKIQVRSYYALMIIKA